MGQDAAMVPWLVIHHNTDLSQRNSYFSMLQEAYQNEDISSTQFCLYLGRSHEFAFGNRLQMESPYTEEDEIMALIKALDLEN